MLLRQNEGIILTSGNADPGVCQCVDPHNWSRCSGRICHKCSPYSDHFNFPSRSAAHYNHISASHYFRLRAGNGNFAQAPIKANPPSAGKVEVSTQSVREAHFPYDQCSSQTGTRITAITVYDCVAPSSRFLFAGLIVDKVINGIFLRKDESDPYEHTIFRKIDFDLIVSTFRKA